MSPLSRPIQNLRICYGLTSWRDTVSIKFSCALLQEQATDPFHLSSLKLPVVQQLLTPSSSVSFHVFPSHSFSWYDHKELHNRVVDTLEASGVR